MPVRKYHFQDYMRTSDGGVSFYRTLLSMETVILCKMATWLFIAPIIWFLLPEHRLDASIIYVLLILLTCISLFFVWLKNGKQPFIDWSIERKGFYARYFPFFKGCWYGWEEIDSISLHKLYLPPWSMNKNPWIYECMAMINLRQPRRSSSAIQRFIYILTMFHLSLNKRQIMVNFSAMDQMKLCRVLDNLAPAGMPIVNFMNDPEISSDKGYPILRGSKEKKRRQSLELRRREKEAFKKAHPRIRK